MSAFGAILAPSPIISATPQSLNITVFERVKYENILYRLREVFPSNEANEFKTRELDPVFGYSAAVSFEAKPAGSNPMVDGTGFGNIDFANRNGLYPHGMDVTIVYSTDELENDETGPLVGGAATWRGVTHNVTSGGEYITFNDEDGSLTWEGGGSARGSRSGFMVPTKEHQFTWHRVHTPPWAYMDNCIGCVNSDAIELKTGQILPETMLLLSYESVVMTQNDGTKAYNITYRFSERNINSLRVLTGGGTVSSSHGGWNHYYDTVSGYFRRLKINGSQEAYQTLPFFGATDPSLFRVVGQVPP